jgi:citrate lyase subunit beta / citryl-CoA lyase
MVKRSYLFVPASSEKLMEKAVKSHSDCAIFDLEDAVALSEKENARERAKNYLINHPADKDVYIRINDMTTPYWRDDVIAAIDAGASGVVVPKSESGIHLKTICQVIQDRLESRGEADRKFDVMPLIETAKGVHFAYDIANAHHYIPRLVFGYIDYSLDLGCELTEDGEELIYARSQIVNASRAAGIGNPVDAVYPDLNNPDGLNNDAVRARKIGFKAKLAIHPKQLDIIHEVFTPKQEELEKAREIVEAFEAAEKSGTASIAVQNQLVDYPVYKKAKSLLQLANL